jgi:hypothetical protein
MNQGKAGQRGKADQSGPESATWKTNYGVFDTIVQSSVVGLFHAYGVAVAPLTPVTLAVSQFHPYFPLASIAFTSRRMDAALVLSIPAEVAAEVKMAEGRRLDPRDLVRELVNQTMGRIKNRLSQYQVTLKCSLPTTAGREVGFERIAPNPGPLRVYQMRSIHGHILVALKGLVDPTSLTYSATTQLNDEGDIIFF